MKRSGFIAGLAVAAAVAVPVVASAHHKPGHAGGPSKGPGNADLTIGARPAVTVFRNATVISGRLRQPNNAGRVVTLFEDEYPFGNGDRAATTTRTDANGDYAFTRHPARNTSYRTAVLSSVTYPTPVLSARILVKVRIRMSLRVSDRTPRVGQLVRFSGRACPEHDGLTVKIQRRTRTGRFRTVRRTRLRSATRCSVYTRRFRIYRDGVYRATADDADHARGFSRRRFLNTPL